MTDTIDDDNKEELATDAATNTSAVPDEATSLEPRCKSAKIGYEVVGTGEHAMARLSFPCGRDKRQILFRFDTEVPSLLNTPFEHYVFLKEYAAICSYKNGYIEAAVRFPLAPVPTRLQRLLRFFNTDGEVNGENSLTVQQDGGPVALSLTEMSKDLSVLIRASLEFQHTDVSLKITGVSVSQHDKAVQLLETLSNSLFFQIELMTGTIMNLVRRRPLQAPARRKRSENLTLEFPRYEYDAAPISLYWYAKNANNMPLLRFLAYYQTIEFYFPVYTQATARKEVQAIIKHPAFRTDREADIARLLATMRAGSAGGFGDERSQLRATCQECLHPDHLREFIEANPAQQAFLSSKSKGLTSHAIPVNNPTADLRNDVADRLYDIRCKVVHTKNAGREGEIELLLPYSDEERMLNHDISLVEYVARQVLIASSSPIKL